MKKCPSCEKGELIEVDDIMNEIDGYVFVVKGRRCTSCKEEFIDETEGQKMIQLARKAGVWGEHFKLHRKLTKSGRGTILRIPSDLEENLQLKGNERVAISKLGNKRFLVEIE